MQSPSGTLVVKEVNAEGENVEIRRRFQSLYISDAAKAFGQVAQELHLNLQDLRIESSEDKKLLAWNLNNWLINRDTIGHFSLASKALKTLPFFVLGLYPEITKLNLQCNELESLPSELNLLTRLISIDLSYNLFTNSSQIVGIEKLPRLRHISLNGNQFTTIPTEILNINTLQRLDFEGNQLDTIPEELCAMTELEVLNLRYNSISYIPDAIGQLTKLQVFLLDGNILIEPFPSSFFTLPLQHLSLQSTCLQSIPSEMFEFKELRSLNVSHNSISEIPPEIQNFRMLESLHIAHNEIDHLPDEFGWLISLKEFSFHGRHNRLRNIPQDHMESLHKIRLFFRNKYRAHEELREQLFYEPRCINNIRWSDTSSNEFDSENILVGATIEQFVVLLTHETFASPQFTRCFLLLYRDVCSPGELLSLLILRYASNEKQEATTSTKIIATRTLIFIAKWIKFYSSHFTDDMASKLMSFIASVPENEIVVAVKKSISLLLSDDAPTPVPVSRPTSIEKIPKPIVPDFSNFPITAIHPKELARQLCLMEYEIFSKIQVDEFMNQNWTRKGKGKHDTSPLAPNLSKFIHHFNRFNFSVVSTVIWYKDTKQRVQVVSLFIMAAEECRLLNNFNSVIEIVTALDSNAVRRLKITWKLLPTKILGVWESLKELTSLENNGRNYRQALTAIGPEPTIPNIGIILKDLTFLDDGNPKYLDNNPELVNFSKMRRLEMIIEQIQRYQTCPFVFEKVLTIQNAIMGVEILDEKAAYAESLICEDKQGKTPAMRGEVISDKADTIINLDFNITPQQLAEAEKKRTEWKDKQKQLGLTTGNEATKTGYLLLREEKCWKRMWFSMQYPALYFFAKQTDKRPTGVIKLSSAKVETIGKKKEFAIVISTRQRPFAIRGDNDKESRAWLAEISRLTQK